MEGTCKIEIKQLNLFSLFPLSNKLQDFKFRIRNNQMISGMKNSLLFLVGCFLCLFTLTVKAQTTSKNLNYALETNTLSWLSGHGGPDLKFIVLKGRWQWYAGVKFPFYHTYQVKGMPEDNLLFHRQRFAYGIDPIIGFRATFGRFQIGSFMQYGRYYYNNSRLMCVNGTSYSDPDYYGSPYTVCESVGVNNFREVTGRFGTGLETQVRLLKKGSFSVHFGTSIQLNVISTHYEGFINNSENGLNGVHDSWPEIHSSFNRLMLEDMAMYHRTDRTPKFEKVRVAQRIFLNLRYEL